MFDVSGDELFSDTYPMKLVDDCLYEVYGKVSLFEEQQSSRDCSLTTNFGVVCL